MDGEKTLNSSKEFNLDAFLDGATAAGLFGWLRRPGAPTQLVDSRSVEEFMTDFASVDDLRNVLPEKRSISAKKVEQSSLRSDPSIQSVAKSVR